MPGNVWTFWIIGASVMISLASEALAAGSAASLRLLTEQYRTRQGEFAEEIETVAQLVDQQNQPGTAEAIRELALPFEEQPQDVDHLPDQVQAELPANLSDVERHWRTQLDRVRSEYARDLYVLSRKALAARHVSFAFRLVRETAFHDPDHRHARTLLGYVRHEDRWVTPYARQMLKSGNVWHERFGWLPNSHLEKYEAGLRNYRGRWISAEEEAGLRHDFRNAWEVRTDHFLIRTNHSLERGVQLGMLLEKFHHFFRREFATVFNSPQQMQQLFDGTPGRRTLPRRHEIHYFQSQSEFVLRLKGKQPNLENSNGLYLPNDRTTYSYYSDTDIESNEETLLHEVTHQLLSESQRRIPEVGREANFWLIEGIACYLESFEIDERGRVHVGDPRHIRIQNARERLLLRNFFIPLRQFTALGMYDFQHPADLDTLRGYYSQGSGLTHFFLHYEDGLYRDALIEHLAQIYSPIPRVAASPDSLAELTGVSIDELDRQYRSYLTEMQSALDHAAAIDR